MMKKTEKTAFALGETTSLMLCLHVFLMSELTVKAHRHIINPDGISPRTKAKTIALARLKT